MFISIMIRKARSPLMLRLRRELGQSLYQSAAHVTAVSEDRHARSLLL
jgi:hypothetical protein